MAKPIPDISVRGVRASIPSGYLLGRQSQGSGPVELIPVSSLQSGQGVSGTGGGGGGGSSTLAGDTDVGITTPGDAQLLVYNGPATKWENVSLSGDATITDAGVLTLAGTLKKVGINFNINGGGFAIGTGLAGWLRVPFNCTITEVTLLADQTGSIQVNIWKCTYAQFDWVSHPVAADKITAAAPPAISAGVKYDDTTLTGWTTAINAGDILAFNVDSTSGVIQNLFLGLTATKA